MNVRGMAVAAVATAAITLTACADQHPQAHPYPPSVVKWCALAYSDGSTEIVDDNKCEDHLPGYFWYFGGLLHRVYVVHETHYYVTGGSRRQPVNTRFIVRAPAYGGDSRTQGYARVSNSAVDKRYGTTPTYVPRTAYGSVKTRSSDDYRQPKTSVVRSAPRGRR